MSHNALFNAAIVTNFRDSRNSLIRDGVQFCSGLVDLVVCVGPSTIVAECRLADALDKAISPNNNVHADRRPELYGRLTQRSDHESAT